ncbi:MAG: hypothetical protein JWN82_515 [Candidatus Saccharibacteria bacterium]|nr:hypothetical protein [Candidatus Saccharibacteria bacterium]
MRKHNQNGAINVLVLPLILASLFLIGALGFGFWAYGERQDYKNNSDQKAAAAVVIAKQQEAAVKDKQYAEAAKLPLKTYNGPEEYGSLALQYPKTWSAYVVTGEGSDAGLSGYFNPDFVPTVGAESSTFALRIEVVDSAYSEVLSDYSDQEGVTITPYALPKLPKVIGVKVDGQIEDAKKGSMVILPVRDKTLKIYTEADAFMADFNNNILPNLTFSP